MTPTLAAQPLSAEQDAVFNRIERSSDHLFVTGRAGTGKSTILNHLTSHTSKNVAICAPTGVAALNVQGQTVHSLLRLPIGVIADQPLSVGHQARQLLASIDTLVIDEISMVSADLMDAIDRVLRIARRNRSTAFGGVQIVMFGDPFQLPPVPPRDPQERAYFDATYRSLWFFDAKVWQTTQLDAVELVTVHRQSDSRFKQLLGAVRHGTITDAELQELNAAGAKAPHAGALTLATTNAKVAQINAARLAEIAGPAYTSRAQISGSFSKGAYPAEELLQLKVGAQVMFVRNDPDGRWVNGTIGTVSRLTGGVHVRVAGDPREHLVYPAKWDRYAYSYDAASGSLEKNIAASFTQIPLRLAWAVTVHKSQGHTYDEATVDIGVRAFSAGQTYVALSRLRSLDGLRLSRPLELADIIVDPDVVRFMGGSAAIAA